MARRLRLAQNARLADLAVLTSPFKRAQRPETAGASEVQGLPKSRIGEHLTGPPNRKPGLNKRKEKIIARSGGAQRGVAASTWLFKPCRARRIWFISLASQARCIFDASASMADSSSLNCWSMAA